MKVEGTLMRETGFPGVSLYYIDKSRSWVIEHKGWTVRSFSATYGKENTPAPGDAYPVEIEL